MLFTLFQTAIINDQTDFLDVVISYIITPWVGGVSDIPGLLNHCYVIIMGVFMALAYIAGKRGKLTLLQYANFLIYLMPTLIYPIILVNTFWYVALPIIGLLSFGFLMQVKKGNVTGKLEDEHGITSFSLQERELQKKKWELKSEEEQIAAINSYRKKHKHLYNINMWILLSLLVLSISIQFLIRYCYGEKYIFFP